MKRLTETLARQRKSLEELMSLPSGMVPCQAPAVWNRDDEDSFVSSFRGPTHNRLSA